MFPDPGAPWTGTSRSIRPELERDSRSLLDGAELGRARAMTPRTRQDFLAGRLAQRRFAAGLLGVPASDLTAWYSCPRCGTGPDISHGRPGYLLRGQAAPLLLSLSRAAGWTLWPGSWTRIRASGWASTSRIRPGRTSTGSTTSC